MAVVPGFLAVNDAISPFPDKAKPMPGVSLTHAKVLAVPVKLMAAVISPLITLSGKTSFTVGRALTAPVTTTFWLPAPAEVNDMLPDKPPVGAAADRTYTAVLLTVPPDGVIVRLPP